MKLYETACIVARQSSDLFAHPWAILLFPLLCLGWMHFGGSELGLTLVLSILAITTTQLVLLAQDRDTKAIHKKLDAIIAGTDADDEIAGIERD